MDAVSGMINMPHRIRLPFTGWYCEMVACNSREGLLVARQVSEKTSSSRHSQVTTLKILEILRTSLQDNSVHAAPEASSNDGYYSKALVTLAKGMERTEFQSPQIREFAMFVRKTLDGAVQEESQLRKENQRLAELCRAHGISTANDDEEDAEIERR